MLKIDDGRGRHAFIGLGFTERNEAFDFNVALSDHEKHARQAKEKVAAAPIAAGTAAPAAPSADFRLKVCHWNCEARCLPFPMFLRA